MPDRFVAAAGNIEAEKTSLGTYVSTRYGFRPVYEPFANNPYLDDFYFHTLMEGRSKQAAALGKPLDASLPIFRQRTIPGARPFRYHTPAAADYHANGEARRRKWSDRLILSLSLTHTHSLARSPQWMPRTAWGRLRRTTCARRGSC